MRPSTAVAFERDPSDEWRPTLHPQVAMEVIEGESIVLDRTHQRVHHLNEVATFIVGCCTGHRTEAEIVAAVVDRFEVDDAVARSDTRDLLARLRDLDILV